MPLGTVASNSGTPGMFRSTLREQVADYEVLEQVQQEGRLPPAPEN